jgi:HlyD family secretion protein
VRASRGLSAWLLALLGLCACFDGGPPPAVGTLERDRLDLVAEASEPVVARPAQAEGARARAAARQAELVRGPRPERIAEARARLQGAEGRLVAAREDLARSRDLFDEGVLSPQQRDELRAIFDESLAARDAAKATLAELLDGTSEEELAQVEAALTEAEAAVAEARIQLGRLEVRAPTAGWLDALPYELGERPPVGGVVAVLLEDDAPYARVYVPASLRVHVRPGTPARVHVDGIDEPIPGRVRTVSRDASFTPYFALTERDRGRLVYLAKVDLLGPEARSLPTGVPVAVELDAGEPAHETADGPD